MISVPKGLLRLAALRLLSESSLSGSDLQRQIGRASEGRWRPGPGSIYFMLAELRRKGLIVEVPKGSGTIRRYVASSKGRDELARLSSEVDVEVKKQIELLSVYGRLAGKRTLEERLAAVASQMG